MQNSKSKHASHHSVFYVYQPEEWELMFNYLLPLPDLLAEALVSLRLHKIPLHLVGKYRTEQCSGTAGIVPNFLL
jgi:hypothetical protein